jgi:hypothetical protein
VYLGHPAFQLRTLARELGQHPPGQLFLNWRPCAALAKGNRATYTLVPLVPNYPPSDMKGGAEKLPKEAVGATPENRLSLEVVN